LFEQRQAGHGPIQDVVHEAARSVSGTAGHGGKGAACSLGGNKKMNCVLFSFPFHLPFFPLFFSSFISGNVSNVFSSGFLLSSSFNRLLISSRFLRNLFISIPQSFSRRSCS